MKIYFQFNSKSRGQNIPKAKSIAGEIGYETQDNYNLVEFEDPDDPRLAELYRLVGNLKGSAIYIKEDNQKEILDTHKFFKTLQCPDKYFCDGFCAHISVGKLPFKHFFDTYGHLIEDNILTVYDKKLIESFAPFLKEDDEQSFIIDKDAILEYYKENTVSERRFCEKYDQNLVIEKIGSLPSIFHYIPLEDIRKNFRKEYVSKELQQINRLINNMSIDSKLSPKEYLEAMRGVQMMTSESYPIKGTGTWMGTAKSTQEREQEIVFWKILPKEYEKNTQMEAILTKKGSMFLIESPIADIIFKVASGTEEDLDPYLERVKQLKK